MPAVFGLKARRAGDQSTANRRRKSIDLALAFSLIRLVLRGDGPALSGVGDVRFGQRQRPNVGGPFLMGPCLNEARSVQPTEA